MISARTAAFCIVGLLVLRAIMAALLPLSADEAYYWLWSRYPDLGYFDHPPMIAWLIGGGTFLLGNTILGVRLAGIVLSVPATWLVWRTAQLILKDEDRAGLAALFFNASLMVSVEMLAATPDMPSLVTSAAFVFFLARVAEENDGRSWLGAGVAGGLGLLSKLSALFLGVGALLWLVLDRKGRKWLLTPWPYLGAGLALLIFAPNLFWQSQHNWETFAFQLARTASGHFTLRFLGEFLAAQLGLATPLIFLLMAAGLWRASKSLRGESDGRLMLALLVWVGLGYFLVHALHDRVQGNWPCYLYPALCILAADAFAPSGRWRRLSVLAMPVAVVMLIAVYLQAQFGLVPLKRDPLFRILGREFAPIAEVVAALVKTHLAQGVLTSDYETTAWLRFNHPEIPVVQVNEPQRYPHAPPADAQLLQRPLIYLTELRRDQHLLVQKSFAYTGFPTQLQTPSSLYMVYPVGRPKSSQIGKMP